MRIKLGLRRLLWAAAALLLASSAYAQNAGSLRGTVTDSTGAVVPGATVVLTNEDTKSARQAVSDAKGGYFFASVIPGSYTVTVELSGFKTKLTKGVRISPNDTRGLDVALDLGAQTETVEVTAEREMLQTETGAREGLITAAQIENLSIISRSPMELLRILPGVVAPDQNSLESVSNGGGANATNMYNVNGVRGSNNVVTLDGSRMIDIGANNGLIIAPNTDFVSEVKIQSSNYAAEFGSGGVQVSAITKGGGSEFHGTIYDYLRHHKLAANDRSNSIAGVERPKSKFQYPGANLSGPILLPGTGFNKNRDKAFFFFGIELWRQKVDTGSAFAVVPTLEQRQGLFGNLGGGQNLNQPTTVNIPRGFAGAGTPAPGNDLSPYVDPKGQALINLYPKPNYNDPNNRYNYVFNALGKQETTQLSATTRASARSSMRRRRSSTASPTRLRDQVPNSLIPSRNVFLMPRVNFAWDVSGSGDLVVRGGGGLFYNRPLGNAEYDVIRMAPNAYNSSIDANAGSNLGPVGLTYDTVGNVDALGRIGRLGILSVSPNSIHYPRTFTGSFSVAKRIPFQQVLEVGYVGTFGRHLLNVREINTIQPGRLLSGTIGNADLSNPLHRAALAGEVIQSLRPFPGYGDCGNNCTGVGFWEYTSTSNYHSLQATLSPQTGKRFQYFVAYTFGKALGTSFANGEYDRIDPFSTRERSRHPIVRPHPHPERLVQLPGARHRQERLARQGSAEWLAALRHHDLGERRPAVGRIQR